MRIYLGLIQQELSYFSIRAKRSRTLYQGIIFNDIYTISKGNHCLSLDKEVVRHIKTTYEFRYWKNEQNNFIKIVCALTIGIF